MGSPGPRSPSGHFEFPVLIFRKSKNQNPFIKALSTPLLTEALAAFSRRASL
jgi:hypothetical protein